MAEIRLYHSTQLDNNEWQDLQALQRDALASTLDRPPEDIDTLVSLNDPDRFIASHADPNTEVGHRYNFNQLYTAPRVAVATEAGEPIGFAYSAHNVSGGGPPEGPQNDSLRAQATRFRKRLSLVKNYLWLREVAVKPDRQREGIATDLGRRLLQDALPFQPVAAYIWPDEMDFMQGALERVGFQATGEQGVKPFGEDSDTIRQVRMQAKSARAVLGRMQ